MNERLIAALKRKFRTPEAVLRALDLDPALIRAESLLEDFAAADSRRGLLAFDAAARRPESPTHARLQRRFPHAAKIRIL
jgi:hypothetical protein